MWPMKNKIGYMEIMRNNLTRKILFFTLWSIPVSSITNIAKAQGSNDFRRGSSIIPMGFVIKANNKTFMIPGDLKEINILNMLIATNPNIINQVESSDEEIKNYSKPNPVGASFYSNDLINEYSYEHRLRDYLVMFILAALMLILLGPLGIVK